MLHYALLHLFGYQVSMDDLKNFRVGPYLSPIESIDRHSDYLLAIGQHHPGSP